MQKTKTIRAILQVSFTVLYHSPTRYRSEILGTTVLVYPKFSKLSKHIIYNICSVAIVQSKSLKSIDFKLFALVQCQTNCLVS